MREIRMQKLLKIEWRLTCEQEGDVRPDHVSALEKTALEKVAYDISKHQRYRGGVLEDNIKMTDDDPAEGVEYTGFWDFTDVATTRHEYALPYGVRINVSGGGAGITSDILAQLKDPDLDDDPRAEGAGDAMECFLLAMAAEGVDLHDPAIKKAFEEAIEQIAQGL